jgi:hypothetical protein
MIGKPGDTILEINWITNPFRAEKFRNIWLPAAAAVLDFGATGWAFIRSTDDPQHFVQLGLFADKLDFERYWYSPEISDYRVQATGLFQVPIQPIWYTVEGTGEIVPEPAELEAEA